jgi:biopolymer transport protein ExbB
MTSGLLEIIQKGGPLMWAIFACSVVSIGVFVERLIFFHRSSLNTSEFLNGIRNLIRRKQFKEALERCDEAYGPAVRVIQAAILKRHLPKSEVREIVQEVGQMEVPRLEMNLPLLATIGYISPLLGLLGTVTGMIKAFMQINQSMGSAPIGDLAGGIWEALITTAGGLVVAIPTYVAYNFLVSRLNSIVHDTERAGIEVVQLLFDTEAPIEDAAVGKKEKSDEADREKRNAAKEVPAEKSPGDKSGK